MFNLKTFVIFAIYAAVLYFGKRIETKLASRTANRPGLILPVVAWIVAMILSVKNFYIAFDVQFGLYAFLAALCLFVFFSVPAMYFSLLYVEGRKGVRARQLARSQRMRQAKAQQRVQSNIHQNRYEDPVQKEPIVYMPDRNRTRSASAPQPQNARATSSQALRNSRYRQDNTPKR